MKSVQKIFNGGKLKLAEIEEMKEGDFLDYIVDATGKGERIISYFGMPKGTDTEIFALIADKKEGRISVVRSRAVNGHFSSIANVTPQIQLFEREIAEQYGVVFEKHPWFKPVRFHSSYTGKDAWQRDLTAHPAVGVMDYYRVEGEEIHEVAVGPVHAGIIEPGHFRFQCHGEVVFSLEISLGFQHRGIEKMLLGAPKSGILKVIEAAAGDTTAGHTSAYCMNLESLSSTRVSPRAEVIRALALELERLANHTGDLGAIAGDVGYLPTSSFCGRIRGDFLNLSASICGSRFGRGLFTHGGVNFDIDDALAEDMLSRLAAARNDVENAVDLLWSTPSVMARLEGTGTVPTKTAMELGLVGPAARASGIKRDIRHDFPYGIYRLTHIPVATAFHGDVASRSIIRWQEVQKSLDFIEEQLKHIPRGNLKNDPAPLAPNTLSVSLTEGWRGEICHTALTDDDGKFARYKIVDPSFHNWMGLSMALRGEQISDFPLCNKSFNLSYCGYDL